MTKKTKKGGGGKKAGGKKQDFDTSSEALGIFGLNKYDILDTPLGVEATVVGVVKGKLWIEWPGAIKGPLPDKATCKAEMEVYGYKRRPTWAHIQRSIDDRQRALFHQRYNGGAGPLTSAMRLPTYTGADAMSLSNVRPKTAPG